MKFTNELPATPGFYAWRIGPGETFTSAIIYEDDEGLAVARGGYANAVMLAAIGGEWCRLVPAEEIEKAFDEGGDSLTKSWEESRAKRVMEGSEQ